MIWNEGCWATELRELHSPHDNARTQIAAWLCEVEEAQWQSARDIQARFSHASFPSGNLAIFNLNGSNYRLETKVSYASKLVLIIGIRTNNDHPQGNLLEGA